MSIIPDITLLASSAKDASGVGATVDLMAKMATFTARLEVTQASGSSPELTVSVKTSKTGNTWTSLGTFAAVAAAGLWELSIANTERYVRAEWTIAGTAPSFTFAVTAEAEQLYITVEDIEHELSEQAVDQIYDDDNSGEADEAPLMADIRDAQSRVDGVLRGLYALPIRDPVPHILKRITKDIAAAAAERRHPEYARADGADKLATAEAELGRIRTRNILLDIPGEPTAAPNEAFVVLTSARRGWGDIGP